jgi:hypothetical protein
MSYDILVGGAHDSISQTVAVINAAQADIIGLQKVGPASHGIANALGFFYHRFNPDIAIVTRRPNASVLRRGPSAAIVADPLDARGGARRVELRQKVVPTVFCWATASAATSLGMRTF